MPGPWKAWKTKDGFPTLSTVPWKSRRKREIPTFPPPGFAAMGKWKTKSRFPTFPQPLATMTPVLSLKTKERKSAAARPPHSPIRSPYGRTEPISCSSFDWKMLMPKLPTQRLGSNLRSAADQKHAWRLVPANSAFHEQGRLENTPEAVDLWATNLYVRFGGRPIAVRLEQSRGPWSICSASMHTWCCSRCTPAPRRVIVGCSFLPAPRTTPAMPRRCWICCCIIAASTALAAGHGGDSPTAAFGGAAATHDQRENSPEQPSYRLSENVFPPNPAVV